MDDTQMQRVENLMKEMDLILESSNEEYKKLGAKEITVNNIYEKNLEKFKRLKRNYLKKKLI